MKAVPEKWMDECLERYCLNHRVSLIAGVLLVLFLGLTLWAHLPHGTLMTWLGLVLLTQIVQAVYLQRILAVRQHSREHERHWLHGLLATSILTGLGWSSAFFVLNLTGFEPAAVLLMVVMAGIAGYAGITKSAVFGPAIAFETAALLPLTLWLFMQPYSLAHAMAVFSLCSLVILYFLLRQMHETATQDDARRRQLEDQLRMKGHALDHSSEALYLVGEHGCFVYVNEQACRSLGYSREELLTMRVADIDPDFDGKLLHGETGKVRVAGEVFVFETRHQRRDGSIYPVEVQVSELQYNGQVLGMTLVRNISERKTIEQTLRDNEHMLQEAQRIAHVGSWDVDMVNDKLIWSDEIFCIWEIDKTKFKANFAAFLETVHPDDRDRVSLAYNEAITNHTRYDVEHRLLFPDGRIKYILERGEPKYDAQGKPVRFIGVSLDITERKQAEQILHFIANPPDADSFLGALAHQVGQTLGVAYVLVDRLTDEPGVVETVALYADGHLRLNQRYLLAETPCANVLGKRSCCYARGLQALFPRDPVLVDMGVDSYAGTPLWDSTGKPIGLIAIMDTVPFRDEAAVMQILQIVAPRASAELERNESDRQLRMREQEFRSLANNLPDNIARWDRCGRYLYVNPAHERLLGMKLAELCGQTIPDSHGQVKAAVGQVVAGAQAIHAVRQLVQVDGVERLHDVNLMPEFDETGQVISVLGIGRDMTDLYRMQETIVAREAEFRSLAENSPDAIFRYDRACRHIYVNQTVERMTGRSREELLGKSPVELVLTSAVDPDQAQQHIRDVLESGQPLELETHFTAADGRAVTVHNVYVPEFASDGSVQSVLCLGRDVSERKRMEEALRSSEQQTRERSELLNAVVDSSPDLVVFALDQQYRYLSFNRKHKESMRALYGREIAVGMNMLDVIDHQPSREAARQAFDRTLAGESFVEERAHDNVVLTREYWQTFYAPIRAGVDQVTGLTCFVLNITERRRMEVALARREQEFRTLVENAVDTVARYGPDMRRLYANPAFGQLVEGGVQALIDKKPTEVPGGTNACIYEEHLARVLSQGVEAEFELQWCDKSGRELCSLISLTPEFGKDGKVESVLAVGRDISELNVFRQKIHQMAFYDTLTALPNRALFNDRLRQMITDAAWHQQLAGVMLLDLDRFKVVNDTMGHAVGDELLRETGKRLNTCLRTYDTVARLGGDEFAVLLPDVRNAQDLGGIADKMRVVFDAPFVLDGKEVFVSCSIGIALYPNDSTEADDLLKYADSAMYLVKRTGRNHFRFYSRDLTESANERLTLESDLRRAIERDQLELYYQPKVSLADGRMVGSEALLRWKHPVQGMIAPDKFVPVAEDSGLIIEIGAWVLRQACRTACEFNGPGKPLHKVAINLSGRQFVSNDIVTTVCDVLEETGCRPQWIELEITESLLLDEGGEVLDVLKAFRALGITIAIDDFGTGYSALSYLARFPINTLKIDRSFVRSIEADSFRAELVKAILSIAHCLGQQVVAEGVETPGQAAFLQTNGCHIGQGYWYSKPLPKFEFVTLPRQFGG